MELASKAQRKAARFALYATESVQGETAPCIEPLPQDRRFADPAWQQPPFNLIHQSFLLTQQWLWNATNHVTGVSRHHERMVTFTARQALDVVSPTNFVWTNPEVLKRTVETGGANLVNGAIDWWRDALAAPPAGRSTTVSASVPGTRWRDARQGGAAQRPDRAAAVRAGHADGVLAAGADRSLAILKYYILDLSPHNSLVRHLVEQGHTYSCFRGATRRARPRTRRRPLPAARIRAAIDAATSISGGQKLHAVGYCLGGTFLAMLAASMAGHGDDRLASLTLLAAEVDFTERANSRSSSTTASSPTSRT